MDQQNAELPWPVRALRLRALERGEGEETVRREYEKLPRSVAKSTATGSVIRVELGNDKGKVRVLIGRGYLCRGALCLGAGVITTTFPASPR
jgi:hypothetical protein